MGNPNHSNSEQQLITDQYEEYKHEHQKAVANLKKFNSKTKDLVIDIYRNNCQILLNKLRNSIQILQNINQELTELDQSSNFIVTSSTIDSLDINYDEPEIAEVEQDPSVLNAVAVQCPAKIKQNSLIEHEHPYKHFNYPQPEIHFYVKGYKGVCVISYVRKSNQNKSFFIVDNSMNKSTYTEALSKLANLSFELKAHSNWVPGVDDVFGVFLDNCLFRAVKQTKAEPNDKNFKILLIDIGEIFDIDISKTDLYDLPRDVRVMPAQGLYCILDRNSVVTMENIRDGLYKERSFKITKIKKSTIHLDDIKPITNPFYTELITKENLSKVNETTNNKSHTYSALEYTSSSDEFALGNCDTSTTLGNELSKSERQVVEQPIFTENKSTSSAIEAVMTFRPTDDQRICHFYNPRTRSCFKGPNCKLQHLPQLEGGWSRDKVETKTAIAAEIEYPDINVLITIIPTSVELDGSFWGQIEFGSGIGSFMKLKQLNLQLNSAEFVMNYKELDHFPVCSELVIAQYRDHLWYRGKIIGDYDQRFKVFFVDYGNADFIHLDKIRKWDTRCDNLPFQAIRCHIANVSIRQDNHMRKLEVIKKLILNKRMTGIVINNLSDLDVKLLDSNNMDIGDQLVKENLATYRKTITPQHRANCNPIPQ